MVSVVMVKKVVDIGVAVVVMAAMKLVVVVLEMVVGESRRESNRCYCYGSDGSEDSGSVRDEDDGRDDE